MKIVKAVALLVLVVMLANLFNVALNSGMSHGVGMDTFLAGVSDPWQSFINCDLVAGLLLMAVWIGFRERRGRRIQTIAWIWMAMWWGNVVVAAYVLRAANESGGDWSIFFMGRNAPGVVIDQPAAENPLSLRVLFALAAVGVTTFVLGGLRDTGISGLAAFGYLAGFIPVVLTLVLLALDRDASLSGRPLSRKA
jgi:hypothetical protein